MNPLEQIRMLVLENGWRVVAEDSDVKLMLIARPGRVLHAFVSATDNFGGPAIEVMGALAGGGLEVVVWSPANSDQIIPTLQFHRKEPVNVDIP